MRTITNRLGPQLVALFREVMNPLKQSLVRGNMSLEAGFEILEPDPTSIFSLSTSCVWVKIRCPGPAPIAMPVCGCTFPATVGSVPLEAKRNPLFLKLLLFVVSYHSNRTVTNESLSSRCFLS